MSRWFSLPPEITRPEVLFLATLLHDVGKAIGRRDHARRGAELARPIFARLGVGPDGIEDGCRLILHHLLMYIVAVRRDFRDETAIDEFLREAHDREELSNLYLLTIADISTTSPTSMTAWKARMLDELFLTANHRLEGTVDAARLGRIRAEVEQHWDPSNDPRFLEDYLKSMPDRYLLSNTPAEIAAHAMVACRGRDSTVSAALVPSSRPGIAELCVVTGDVPKGTGLCVVTEDGPGLLAAIAAAIVASKLEVHEAQVHTRRMGDDGRLQAVDIFCVRDRSDGPEGIERSLPKLQRDLENVIRGTVTPADLATQRVSRWSERPSPSVATEVSIDDHGSAQHTVIEIITRDRPGLLFTLAQAMHELSLTIHVAKINTEGARVADVFYVSETDGKKLARGERTREVRAFLLAALGWRERTSSSPPPAD
jgi:[protein-PII] uridylyltransferase